MCLFCCYLDDDLMTISVLKFYVMNIASEKILDRVPVSSDLIR